MHTRTDKVFAIGLTLALLGLLAGAFYLSIDMWGGMSAALDPAAVVPMILGIAFSLVVGGIVVGIFLYGRFREAKGEAPSEAIRPPDLG